MVTATSSSSSLKEYLKKYENSADEEKKKKKKKKAKPVSSGVLVVDEDPVWQKAVNFEEEEENDSPDEKPQIDEDIEVKRMRRLELARLTHNKISEDGSGWVPVSDVPKHSTSFHQSSDISPPRKQKARNDTPSPDAARSPSHSGRGATDLSPPRQNRRRYDSPSPEPREGSDLSPPRQRHRRNDSPSPVNRDGGESSDLSPPRQSRRGNDPPLPSAKCKSSKASVVDLSPPRKRGRRNDSPSPEPVTKAMDAGYNSDLSPPRRRGRSPNSPSLMTMRKSTSGAKVTDLDDLSPPRRAHHSKDLSPPRRSQKSIDKVSTRDGSSAKVSAEVDLSPPRKRKEKTGLITGKDVAEETTKAKEEEWSRFSTMDPSTSGRGAQGVYRIKGKRVSKEEFLKLNKKEEKKEDKKLEWGKGLAQKREAEARLQELELEKEKPFARSRDDPDLDRMMKDRLRWGDPMAHLVKRKQPDVVLRDLGDSEKMKESGFIVPQEIPAHSWLKRGVDYEPNRYGIKPGRHWDGRDRSNGFEKKMFKRMSEKKATDREAYLWSVSDM